MLQVYVCIVCICLYIFECVFVNIAVYMCMYCIYVDISLFIFYISIHIYVCIYIYMETFVHISIYFRQILIRLNCLLNDGTVLTPRDGRSNTAYSTFTNGSDKTQINGIRKERGRSISPQRFVYMYIRICIDLSMNIYIYMYIYICIYICIFKHVCMYIKRLYIYE
jgi:hypothetical protein